MTPRQLARRLLPYELRLRVRLVRRAWHDRRQHTIFAATHGDPEQFPHTVCSYERRFIDYPGQEAFALAKRRNQARLARDLHAIVINPGETFSVWRLAGRPTRRAGYLPAAALKAGVLTSETGGAVCLLSTVLYNVALLGALEITERYCHSVDTYGERRYFELARDAAIEYGYRDLRFRNPHAFPVLVRVDVTADGVTASLSGAAAPAFVVELLVDPPQQIPAGWQLRTDNSLSGCESRAARGPVDGLAVTGRRIIHHADRPPTIEPLPATHHVPIPGQLRVAKAARTTPGHPPRP